MLGYGKQLTESKRLVRQARRKRCRQKSSHFIRPPLPTSHFLICSSFHPTNARIIAQPASNITCSFDLSCLASMENLSCLRSGVFFRRNQRCSRQNICKTPICQHKLFMSPSAYSSTE